MTAAMTFESASPRGWWRRNAPWLAGAVVLGVLAFALPWREEEQNQAIRSPQRPVDVPAGGWAHYEGARWRVVETELLPAGGFGSALDLRDDDAMLVVRFEVVPDRNTLGRTLDSCQGRVSDDRGRHWEANPPPLSRYRGKLQRRCGTRSTADFRTEQALGGRPFGFEHVYQIPKGLEPARLRPELRMPVPKSAPKGTYLRFALAPPAS